MVKRQIVGVLVFVGLMSGVCFGVGGDLGLGTEPLTDGSGDHPYLIEDLADFNVFCGNSAYWGEEKYTKLMTDLDLSSMGTYTQAPIAGDPDADAPFDGIEFSGSFDGNGYMIINLSLDGAHNCGLFGCIGMDGSVSGVILKNVSFSCTGYSIGGLAGINDGIISNCSSTGVMSGLGGVGGMVGWNREGSVLNSYANVSESGETDIGGLVGYNNSLSTISNSYATGSVSGDEYVGGLAGCSFGSVTNSYSIGAVSGTGFYVGGLVGYSSSSCIIHCFWDVDTSGVTISNGDGGMGLTTIQMQTLSTFIDAGWDFEGESGNGTDDLWEIPAGSRPILVWQELGPVIVPDVAGLDEADADVALTGVGLVNIVIERIGSFTVPAGQVMEQWPAAGLGVMPWSVVAITVSAGPPTEIATAAELNAIGSNPGNWGLHFILTADIGMSEYDGQEGRPAYHIIGTEAVPFTGSFNGDGHVVSDLTIEANGQSNVGLLSHNGYKTLAFRRYLEGSFGIG